MPSTQLLFQSGGTFLVSGASIFSGTLLPVGNIALKLSAVQSGLIHICLPSLSGVMSTSTSGGVLSSGGMTDGWELGAGETYTVSKSRLTSGLASIRLIVPTAMSGARLYWEYDVTV